MALLSLFISFPALIVSFFQLGGLPFDMAWVAIAICGIPIIKEAAEGLITSLDIKADVLVSIALVAAVAVGEVFAARGRVHYGPGRISGGKDRFESPRRH
jgi:cation transport ATPase